MRQRPANPIVVIALEGAGFAADGLELLVGCLCARACARCNWSIIIRNALGDFQTERPEHDGMTALGIDVVKSCNRLGILVDLAHATNPSSTRRSKYPPHR
jgi:membrane dipeptidase